MARIWKFAVPMMNDQFTIEMPADAIIRFLAIQNGEPQLWVETRASDTTREYGFTLAGTGHEFDPTNKTYIGSFLYHQFFVFHLYLHDQRGG